MTTLSFLLVYSLLTIKRILFEAPPKRYITITYIGAATYPPHQSFFVINSLKKETKNYYLKYFVYGPESFKRLTKEQIELTWDVHFNTVAVNEKPLAVIEKYAETNPKYFTNLDAPKNTGYLFTIRGKKYKVNLDPTMGIFVDLAVYLKKNHCDTSAIKEMNLYLKYRQ